MVIEFSTVVPILRIFDVAKADEFYVDYLGFGIDWEHRFDDNAPLYRQVSRAGLTLHLSEHHGDGSPGAQVRIAMRGLQQLHDELAAKDYRYMRPGIEEGAGRAGREMVVVDPFGNRICFCDGGGDG
ncbi:glyoxalase/bleomycin resistance protein/dioxygenase [Ophiocordyceps camponoti-floridani]|uniref:Bleomycin resistance protein n=1 Tax=Ophiocordyceps camponoti-floridani TaxID=2030778 RepID=A0A8H4Q1I3_9HYPO|nr:glyoxalase/bleomycin resistance protein/dioxygenase [Ophiocordyceps camponoti-floridani]